MSVIQLLAVCSNTHYLGYLNLYVMGCMDALKLIPASLKRKVIDIVSLTGNSVIYKKLQESFRRRLYLYIMIKNKNL